MKKTLDWFKKHEVTIVLCLGLLGIFILPWLFTRPWIGDFTNLGQVGDTIGGTTAPFIGLLSAWLVYRAFKAQIKANELISEQLKLEEQRYAEGKEKDREAAQTTNFLKMYEAYVRALNDAVLTEKNDNQKHDYRGKQYLKFLSTAKNINLKNFLNWEKETPLYPEFIFMDPTTSTIYELSKYDGSNFDDWGNFLLATGYPALINYDSFLKEHSNIFRITYQLLKQELEQEGKLKWENIRFFKAQLTEAELIALAMNILFVKEGREGLGLAAEKSGLFEHLKAINLRRLIKREFPGMDGFFSIEITEAAYKAKPVILHKK
ncbi:hypothetical protein GCM10009007_00170 [Formosimonas limnophila]|uniref:Phage abortive infection protein n=1 Tax=Formosimonas limnophila TaxID=1384487 RepID=A0A8J3FY70_9BURK|nr:hypothetical protein [Formosimonas limnophila]GHA63852.1 hypothetical protein GCM10009007_00170 [Formosimonas limnophila]